MHRSVLRAQSICACVLALAGCSAPRATDAPAALPAVTPIMMPPAMAAGTAEELVGRAWSWQGTTYAGNRQVVPDAPERYSIEFMPDGRVQLRADCNRGGARYEARESRSLTLGPAALTKMGCPPGSKDTEFVRQLGDVAAYRFVDGNLVLALNTDNGSMRFAPLSR
jgi:heat shock protein HslJ